MLVVVSDGDDTVKTSTYAQALEEALRGEVMIYSLIDVPIEASAGRDTGGEHALITLAEQTGGKYFYVADGGLDKAFEKVSDDLRTQYLLGYYPHNQEPGRIFHRIRGDGAAGIGRRTSTCGTRPGTTRIPGPQRTDPSDRKPVAVT